MPSTDAPGPGHAGRPGPTALAGPPAPLRSVLLRQFLAAVHDDPAPVLARVARARMDDPHVRPGEIRRLEEIAARAERQAAVS